MATKVTDALFIGDGQSSQDPEFIELNKITYIMTSSPATALDATNETACVVSCYVCSNCAGRELPNLWDQHGIRYLTFAWQDKASCLLFDPDGFIVVDQIATFIDEATDKGDSVLICSTQGHSRCIACVASYLMHRYRWSAHKSLQFVEAKRPDMELQPSFLR
eukprot:4684-Heterococcus_DN1.PRE.5